METHIETTRKYAVAIPIDIEFVDSMPRNSFIAFATSAAEKAKQELKALIIKEYDERHDPVRPDTVVS